MSGFLDFQKIFDPGHAYFTEKLNRKGSGPDTSAQDLYASLTRRSWYDYMNTLGVPQENRLIDYATNPETVTNAMAEASADVTGAFDRQTTNTQRKLAGLGLSLTPEEQAASTRDTGIARSLADVGAQNRSRDLTIARQQSILGNPAPTIGALK